MRPQLHVDGLIAGLAGGQHGVVARRQLLVAGLTARQVAWRLRTGRLHRVHRGVYLVGHGVFPPLGREMAALLACGVHSVLSHRSAVVFWGLSAPPLAQAGSRPSPSEGRQVVVTVPPQSTLKRPGVEIHRMRLARRDWMIREGLRVTSPARALLDTAWSVEKGELERMIAEAQYRKLVSERQLRDQLERNGGRPGSRALREILDLPGGPRRSRSPAERRMLRILRQGKLTGYELNKRVHGFELDVLWPELDFAVEIDGYDGHAGRVAFERDRLKISKLQAHGISVMPITGKQLRDDPAGALERLLAALERRAGERLRG